MAVSKSTLHPSVSAAPLTRPRAVKKPSAPFALPNVIRIGRDPRTGEEFLLVRGKTRDGESRDALLSHADLDGGERKICSRLRRAGIRVSSLTSEQQKIVRHLEAQAPSKRFTVLSQVGWMPTSGTSGPASVFALPDQAIGKAASSVRIRLRDEFPAQKFTRSGDLAGWQAGLAALIHGNKVGMFSICAAFASPIIRLLNGQSAGFQLVAPSSSGKSLCARAAGSVWGGNEDRPFHETWLTTVNNLDRTATDHSDIFLVLDETGLASASGGRGNSLVAEAAYVLAEGREKGRQTNPAPLSSWRLIYLSTSEKTLAELAAEAGKLPTEGQLGRVSDICVPVNKRTGLFQDLHGTVDVPAFGKEISAAIAANSGVAGPAYIQGLVAWIERDKAELQLFLEKRAAAFKKSINIKNISLIKQRQLESFSLVYAAGRLAKKLSVINWGSKEILKSIKYCFSLVLDNNITAIANNPIEQVTKYIRDNREEFIDLQEFSGDITTVLQHASGFIYKKNGELEYLFERKMFWRRVCSGLHRKVVVAALKKKKVINLNKGDDTATQRVLPSPVGRVRMISINPTILD